MAGHGGRGRRWLRAVVLAVATEENGVVVQSAGSDGRFRRSEWGSTGLQFWRQREKRRGFCFVKEKGGAAASLFLLQRYGAASFGFAKREEGLRLSLVSRVAAAFCWLGEWKNS